MSLATIGAELHADPDFGLECTVTLPGESAVVTTVRAVNSQSTDPQSRVRKSDTLTCLLYFLTSAVARPPKGSIAVITGDTPYAGTWKLAEAGEPTTAREWRCPAVRDTTTNAIMPSAGSPRPTVIP